MKQVHKTYSTHERTRPIMVGNHQIGKDIVVIAGPCSVESQDQILTAARQMKAAGATMLRGGAFKPRSSPYSFQGLGERGIRFLYAAKEETGLPIVSELMTPDHLPLFEQYVDVIQIGARNMQNYDLLKAVGRSHLPVLLKRGLSARVDEFLLAAEYIMAEGNDQVILCERGIRTFETATRSTLDLSAVPVLKEKTYLPVIVDPSHAAGRYDLVAPLSKAAIAVGADGLIIEVHPNPKEALCDGPQSLTPKRYGDLINSLVPLAASTGRQLAL